jgi:hypothetical protein
MATINFTAPSLGQLENPSRKSAFDMFMAGKIQL